jgi:hypothetical protein
MAQITRAKTAEDLRQEVVAHYKQEHKRWDREYISLAQKKGFKREAEHLRRLSNYCMRQAEQWERLEIIGAG